MIISLVLLAIGVLVLTAGMYYLIKERWIRRHERFTGSPHWWGLYSFGVL